MSSIEFEKLVGQELYFFGVDNTMFKLGAQIWEAIENEDDGYRSYLDSILVTDKREGIFSAKFLAQVRMLSSDDVDFDGWKLVDISDGHVWLRVGTDNSDDYYPNFVFDYAPKVPLP